MYKLIIERQSDETGLWEKVEKVESAIIHRVPKEFWIFSWTSLKVERVSASEVRRKAKEIAEEASKQPGSVRIAHYDLYMDECGGDYAFSHVIWRDGKWL
jgi:hypothetical protein